MHECYTQIVKVQKCKYIIAVIVRKKFVHENDFERIGGILATSTTLFWFNTHWEPCNKRHVHEKYMYNIYDFIRDVQMLFWGVVFCSFMEIWKKFLLLFFSIFLSTLEKKKKRACNDLCSYVWLTSWPAVCGKHVNWDCSLTLWLRLLLNFAQR